MLLFLGLWVAILPYLGFSHSWKDILFTLTGLVLVAVSYMLYKEARAKEPKVKEYENFSENKFENEEIAKAEEEAKEEESF
jgi:amino acid permease